MKREVSVIIPSYNRAEILEYTIPKYYQEVVAEIIIVDDHSTDHTKEVVERLKKEYPCIRYIRLKHNHKQPYAKNIGIKYAKYPFVCFGDDDSFVTQGTIRQLLVAVKTTEFDVASAKVFYLKSSGQLKNIDSTVASFNKIPASKTNIFFDYNSQKTNYYVFYKDITPTNCGSTCFLTRAENLKNCRFNHHFVGNCFREETDFQIQLLKQNNKICFVPNCYMINLPPSMSKGGVHIYHHFKKYVYSIINNAYFLYKNYYFLSKNKYVKKSIWLMNFEFIKMMR